MPTPPNFRFILATTFVRPNTNNSPPKRFSFRVNCNWNPFRMLNEDWCRFANFGNSFEREEKNKSQIFASQEGNCLSTTNITICRKEFIFVDSFLKNLPHVIDIITCKSSPQINYGTLFFFCNDHLPIFCVLQCQ